MKTLILVLMLFTLSMSNSNFLKVIDVQILTLASREGVADQRTRPFLRFELEDGSEFMMSGIPHDVAISLSMELNGIQSKDTRLQIHDLVGELALIDKIEIDLVVPDTEVYQATIYLNPEGFERTIQFQLVPSHATLLGVLNQSPIFVSEQLVRQAESLRDPSNVNE